MKRLLTVGLEPDWVQELRDYSDYLVVAHDVLPKMKLISGQLWVESTRVPGRFLPVDAAVYYGIFANDFDSLTLLALWGGPCFPNAQGMMDCRLRIPALVRALATSRFGRFPRSMSLLPQVWKTDIELVAKWGNWHCGDNKDRFTGNWSTIATTLFEPFVEGEAVRVMVVGDQSWQVKLGGAGWLKSIHNNGAVLIPTADPELVDDAQNLAKHFKLELAGVDYMVASNGEKFLLEVNHIPSISAFRVFEEAFFDEVKSWLESLM